MAEKSLASAVIDIGSTAIRLKVAQPKGGEPEEIESAEYPLNFGDDTFARGSISFGEGAAASHVLSEMVTLAGQYGVERERIRVTATTALREAENSLFVKDRMEIAAGVKIDILSDVDEKSLIFCELLRKLSRHNYSMEKPFMMAYIGTASLGVAIVRGGDIVYYRNIRAGTLTMTQMLNEIEQRPGRIHESLEDYLESLVYELREQIREYKPRGFVVCGREIDLIARLVLGHAPQNMDTLKREDTLRLYDDIKNLTPGEVAHRFRLREENGSVLLPALALYITLGNCTDAGEIVYCQASTSDWLVYEALYPREAKAWRKRYEKSISASAYDYARRMGCDITHSAAVEGYALALFDGIKKLHGFSRREKLYLQVAAILHDCGKFNNMKNHSMSSYHLILDNSIIGFSPREQTMTACIARYHNVLLPWDSDEGYSGLREAEKMTVAKLSAILRLAESMDASHKQKIVHPRVEQRERGIAILVEAREDIALEAWSFRHRVHFFSDVFGLECALEWKKGEA